MATTSRKSDILKVRLGQDTRRMVLYNTLISYDDLVLMLQRVFDGKLRSNDEVTLKYRDEDGDLITIADASDFAHAREYSPNGVVKMIVFINGSDVGAGCINQQSIRKELAEVRDKVNSLVDMLDSTGLEERRPVDNYAQKRDQPPPVTVSPISSEAASMFDPLKPTGDAAPSAQPASTMTTVAATTTVSSSSTVPSVVSSSQSASTTQMFSDQTGITGSQFFDQPASNQPHSQSIASAPPPSSNTGYTPTPPPAQTSQSGYPSPAPPTTQSGYAPPAQTSQSGYLPPAQTSQLPPAQTTQSGYPPAAAPSTTQSGYTGYPYANQPGAVASAPRYPPPGSQSGYPQPQAAAYAQYGATNTYSPQPAPGTYSSVQPARFPQPYGNPYKMGYRN